MLRMNLLALTATIATVIGLSDASTSHTTHIRVHFHQDMKGDSAKLWEQCGGENWSTACEYPGLCFRESKWYAQCRDLTQPGKEVPLYQQCGGGINYPASSICTEGAECKKIDASYSQCVPSPVGGRTIPWWGQCGGKEYHGPTNCAAGSSCKRHNDWYYQCTPKQMQKMYSSKHSLSKSQKSHLHTKGVGLWQQCGGKGYKGDKKCNEGLCYADNEWYSQCRPLTKPGEIVPLWGQCGGGLHYPGSTDCGRDAKCVKSNNSWSMCEPKPRSDYVEGWGQCNGKNYKGPHKCVEGFSCKYWSPWYSQCVNN